MVDDRLLTTAETARALNTPVATLRWWRYQGTGPKSFRLGARKVMYRRSDVESWLRAAYEADGANVAAQPVTLPGARSSSSPAAPRPTPGAGLTRRRPGTPNLQRLGGEPA